MFKLEPLRASHIVVVPEVEQVGDVEDHCLIALIAEVFLVALWPEEPRLSGAGRIAA